MLRSPSLSQFTLDSCLPVDFFFMEELLEFGFHGTQFLQVVFGGCVLPDVIDLSPEFLNVSGNITPFLMGPVGDGS